MVSETVKVNLVKDAEARPVAVLVQIASQFESKVYIRLEDKNINAKSIMGMMTMAFYPGEQVVVCADGEDEEEAVERMERFFTEEE